MASAADLVYGCRVAWDPAPFFSALRPHLGGVDVGPMRVQIELLEADAGDRDWYIALSDEGVEIERGEHPAPHFGILLNIEDLRDLSEGAATLRACLIDGRVEIEGDVGKAMQLLPKIFGTTSDE